MESPLQVIPSDPASGSAEIDSLCRELERRRALQPPLDREQRVSIALPVGEITPFTARTQEDFDREEQDRIRRQRDECWRELLKQAGTRYGQCRLNNFICTTAAQTRVVKELGGYCETIGERLAKREGIVLYGPVGTGKDHLAFAVARAAVGAFRTVRWVNGQQWFGDIRDAMDTDRTEEALIGRLGWSDLTVISDPLPPVGQLTQHQATMLYRAVHARYEAGKATIVTVNVGDDSEADSRLGAPTWDRLCDGAWKVQCNWPSYRKPAREIR